MRFTLFVKGDQIKMGVESYCSFAINSINFTWKIFATCQQTKSMGLNVLV